MWWNTLLLALRAIRRNLMRSMLTVLGVVIGVAAVITMVTLGNGATRTVAGQIASMGSNLLILMPGQRYGPDSDSAPPFRQADVEAIAAQISEVKAVAPLGSKSVTAVYMAQNWSTVVMGSSNAYFDAGNWVLDAGRNFSDVELRGKSVCVIGATVREKLFASQNPVGSMIRIKQFACEVIGLLKSKGQSAMGQDQDDVIVMPLKTVQRRLVGNNNVSRILVSVQDDAAIDNARDQLLRLFRERRNITGSEDDDFRVMDTRQLAEVLTGTTQVLTTLLGAVAAVSLLVGGIGIMNIMLVSVTERTREIGIRLAIGALEREVLLQFLIEAVVLSTLGGLLGIVLAVVASVLLADMMQVSYRFEIGINVVSCLFSAVIGVVFGYFPARRAARLDPIDALRHE